MKDLTILLILAIPITVVTFIWYIADKNLENKEETKIEIDQTWEYVGNKDNPFETTIYDTNVVIEIKNDYILYVQNDKDTFSIKYRLFPIGSKYLK